MHGSTSSKHDVWHSVFFFFIPAAFSNGYPLYRISVYVIRVCVVPPRRILTRIIYRYIDECRAELDEPIYRQIFLHLHTLNNIRWYTYNILTENWKVFDSYCPSRILYDYCQHSNVFDQGRPWKRFQTGKFCSSGAHFLSIYLYVTIIGIRKRRGRALELRLSNIL